MERHTHGGNIYEYERVLDFSANLNPLGMPEAVREAAVSGVGRAEHYPEPDCKKLRESLGSLLCIKPENIICGNGATELVFLAAAAIRPKKALLLAPTYAEYEEALTAYGCECLYYELQAEKGFLPGEDFLEAVTEQVDLVVVCNPNNPTGILLEEEFLGRVLERCLKMGSLLFLDESFMELTGVEGPRHLSGFWQSENVLLLKSMTKTYAMAGLRLGYAASKNLPLIETMYQYKPSWNVSLPAQAAGEAALLEKDYLEQSVSYIREERRFLWEALERFQLQVYGGRANYLFFSSRRTDLKAAFLEQGILIRDCGNYRGLFAGYYRVAVRTHEENEQFVKALEQVFREPE